MAGGTPTENGSGATKGVFVQLADTGRLWLGRRYTGGTSSGPVLGGSGWVTPSNSGYSSWVLRRRSGGPWEEIPSTSGGSSKKFRKMLAPYLVGWPDLLDALEREALDFKRVDQAIRGYNSGEPVFFLDHDY